MVGEKQLFGTTKDGKEVYLYTLENKNGMKAVVMNYGAIWSDFCAGSKR